MTASGPGRGMTRSRAFETSRRPELPQRPGGSGQVIGETTDGRIFPSDRRIHRMTREFLQLSGQKHCLTRAKSEIGECFIERDLVGPQLQLFGEKGYHPVF